MLPVLTPTDFIALANQTLEYVYPTVEIEGEVKNIKVSRNRWVYFDIADETSKIKCFGTVYMLPGVVEDGMKIKISASPRLHPQFGFSLNIISIQFSGEGTIKKAADLLRAKLENEGLFAPERKRQIPYPPSSIGLIASEESAGYKDFIKVLAARSGGIDIQLANVQVQGELAITQVVAAIKWFNSQAETVDVLVIVRGGGSADDLQAFSSEQITRAVAASRIPTVVAIGHEVDVSLAELAADLRASTPSNAAELIVPDRDNLNEKLNLDLANLNKATSIYLKNMEESLGRDIELLSSKISLLMTQNKSLLVQQERTIEAFNPRAVLARGYAVVRLRNEVIRSTEQVKDGDVVSIQLANGNIKAKVQ